MKLCRFELKAEPGQARSGMVYSGKIYETDGSEAVAVHDAETVRPLAPIPHAPSVRIFRSDLQPGLVAGLDIEDPAYFYGNPGSLLGASQLLNFPEALGEVGFETYMAAIIVSDGYQIGVEEADEIVLAFTMLTMLVGRSAERTERGIGALGRSHDLGAVVGPVLTTPDEMDDAVIGEEFGRKYKLSAVARVNAVERQRGDAEDFPFTFAQAISAASQTTPVRAGDIIALGPITVSDEEVLLDPGDEVQLSVEKLGMLSLKLAR